MHFSRAALRLNIVRGFNATYVTHQLVADLFGDRDDRGYLYRVLSRAPREAEVLVLSDRVPATEPAPRDWGAVAGVQSREYDFMPSPGQKLDYEIRINATCVVTDEQGKKSRMDVWDAAFREDRQTERTPHDVYREYLARRVGSSAKILSCRVVERGEDRAAREGRRPIRFISANLIGSIEIGEPQPFLEVMANGIGRSKAFGHGLICLSRPGTILPRRYGGGEML